MNPEANATIRVSHRFRATAERVFDAWLDPERAARFVFATAAGTMTRVEIDARVGGRFCFVDRREGVDVEHTGRYLEIDRPRRLVFEFSVDASPLSRVTIEITSLEAGCELELIHEFSPEHAEHAGRIRQGWTSMLDALAENAAQA